MIVAFIWSESVKYAHEVNCDGLNKDFNQFPRVLNLYIGS